MKRDYMISYGENNSARPYVCEISKGEIARLGRKRECIYSNSPSGFFVYVEAEGETSAICKALDLWQEYAKEISYALVRLVAQKEKEESKKSDYNISWTYFKQKLVIVAKKTDSIEEIEDFTGIGKDSGKLMVRAKNEEEAIARAKEEIKAAYEEKAEYAQEIINACK